LFVTAVCVLTVAGCSGSGGVVPVSGVVTLDNQPLGGAMVEFHPFSESPRVAVGVADEQGRFELTTIDPGDGAMPGTYRVTVDVPDQSPSGDPGTEFDALVAAPSEAQQRIVPVKYTLVDKTPLTVKVPVSGKLELALSTDEAE
jgi:hypothetical protein